MPIARNSSMRKHSKKANYNSISPRFNRTARIVFLHGDARDQLYHIPDESVRLIVTSPPYNIGKEYEDRVLLSEYRDAQQIILADLFRVLAKNGSICWQVGTYVNKGEILPLDILFYEDLRALGLKLRNRIVWHYRHGLHAERRFSGRYETILWFTKGDDYVFNLDPVRIASLYPGKRHYKGKNKGKLSGNPLGKNPSDFWETVQQDWEHGIWDIPNVKANHPEKTIQPCQFPVELVERCILALSNRGDTVLDPYAGVSSTMIAAIKHGRRTIGIEKEKSYFDLGSKRVRLFLQGRLALRALGQPVHQPSGTEKVATVPSQWKKEETRSNSSYKKNVRLPKERNPDG